VIRELKIRGRAVSADQPSYHAWVQALPGTITADPLWSIEAYRLSLYLADLGWADVTKLSKDPRTQSLSDQLCRSLGSIGANIEEGYSRESPRDRARFYEYALGSAREARGWYYRGRHVLGQEVTGDRMNMLAQIIRLLLKMSRDQRGYAVHEEEPPHYPGIEDLLAGAEPGT
jgi:four helix bundle protein